MADDPTDDPITYHFEFQGEPDLSGAVQQALTAAQAAAQTPNNGGMATAIGAALLGVIGNAINSAVSAGPAYPSAPAEDGTVSLGPGVVIKDDRITANGVAFVPVTVQDQALREQVLMIVARLQNERLGGIAQRIRQWYGL